MPLTLKIKYLSENAKQPIYSTPGSACFDIHTTNKAKGLTDTSIKTAKPTDKEYKLFDGGGLFLLVATTGGKRWRLKFRFNNKENIIALGTYPSLSLKDAREIRDNYKSMIAKGINPVEEKKSKLEKRKFEEKKKENTFYKVSVLQV
jgi:hypothetical protein